MDETYPVLYILMRDDLDSMNAGKAMAQASHASNAFVKHAQNYYEDLEKPFDNEDNLIRRDFDRWCTETEQGFGTVLVKAVDENQMRFAIDAAQRYGLIASVVHDPTYPLRDGDTTHSIPLDTCAYVFADYNDPLTKLLVGNYPLHP